MLALQLAIAQDVISAQASDVQAKNTDLWALTSQVPLYAYKSFGDIWIGANIATGDLASRIVYKDGEALEQSQGEISIIAKPFESVRIPGDSFDSNLPGAETIYVDIVLRLPEERQSWDRITQAELRLRWLLNSVWRERRKKTSPYTANLGDYTINGPLYCIWDNYTSSPNAKELWTRYRVSYYRAVPK